MQKWFFSTFADMVSQYFVNFMMFAYFSIIFVAIKNSRFFFQHIKLRSVNFHQSDNFLFAFFFDGGTTNASTHIEWVTSQFEFVMLLWKRNKQWRCFEGIAAYKNKAKKIDRRFIHWKTGFYWVLLHPVKGRSSMNNLWF